MRENVFTTPTHHLFGKNADGEERPDACYAVYRDDAYRVVYLQLLYDRGTENREGATYQTDHHGLPRLRQSTRSWGRKREIVIAIKS